MANRNERSDGPPIFTPAQHPELNTLGRKAIHTFLRERERYLRLVDDAKKQGSSFEPVTLVASVRFDLLKALVSLRTFKGITKVEDLTDDALQEWLDEQDQNALDTFSVDELEAIVKKKLVMKTREPDPLLRVMNLFTDYLMLLSEKKMEQLVDENPKMAISHICGALRPAALRMKIENDISLHKSSLGKDFQKFYEYVLGKAVALDEFLPAIERSGEGSTASGRADDRGNGTRKGETYSKSRSKKGISRQRPDEKNRNQPEPAPAPGKGSADVGNDKIERPPKLPPFCLNLRTCRGLRHYMNDCNETTPEEAKKLLQEHREKQQALGSMRRVRFDDDTEHSDKSQLLEGRILGKLNDVLNVTVCGDYGADHAALSEEHLQLLADANVFVSVLPLAEPIQMDLAVTGQDDVFKATATKKARISLTLSLPEGPLRLRNVPFIVFQETMSEVLLSRPLLLSLGFDLDAHLRRVRDKYHDADFSAVEFSPDHSVAGSAAAHNGRLSQLMRRSEEHDGVVDYLSEDVWGDDLENEHSTEDENNVILATTPEWTIGQHIAAEVKPHMQQMVEKAITEGLPSRLVPRCTALLEKYADIFRLKLGTDPPVDISPMKIRLIEGAQPVQVKVRRYTQPQMDFLRMKVRELEQLGLIRRNAESSWACAPLIVPKPGPEKFRFTVDLRPVNSVTVPHIWPMPDLESSINKLSGKTCFASIDLCQGYWQLPLDEGSQECQSFITPDGVYSPTRVMHGQRNAVAFCQSSVQELCQSILESLLQWLDDMLFHAATPDELLDVVEQFFKICMESNLKLHAAKCKLFLKEVRWCGRLISGKGVRLDPARLDALLNMPYPKKGDELQQFVCASNWMRGSIPEFTKTVAPLQELLEKVYKSAGNKRTKRAAARIQLTEIGWNDTHTAAFDSIRHSLANAVTLSHPDPGKAFCLFTDASEKHWSGILTQVPLNNMDLEFTEQQHEPLAFISGTFTGSSSRWSTPEKEAAAIIRSCERLDYLLIRPQGFHLFTDHSNLVFIYNPEKSNVRMNKTIFNKVQRWGMTLSMFEYTIVHISGDDNCWADLLSRWGTSTPPESIRQQRHLRIAALFKAPIAPDYDPEFTWPDVKDIIAAQAKADEQKHRGLHLQKAQGLLKTPHGAIWIPPEDTHLQLRICVVGHCGRAGHRGLEATLSAIKEHFYWATMETDLDQFYRSCLHCVATIGGQRIPRPMGHALHAEKPNELLHFDFLHMGESVTGDEYALLLKDDASIFCLLYPAKEADSRAATTGLLDWFAKFGVVLTWVSDRGSHFKNKLMDAVNKALHTHHHFTAPNAPHTNGTVERLCREVIRCCRALLSEFRMKQTEWPIILPIVQSVLNHSKHATLGNRAPITVFTGLPADNPLRLIVPPETAAPKKLDEIRALQNMHTESLLEALNDMHKGVHERRTTRRNAAIAKHNQKTHVQKANFSVGDYVLVAKAVAKDGHKLQMQWLGPQRIVRVESDWVYEVEDLLNEKHSLVHANRLKFYSDSQLYVTQELLDTIDNNDVHYNTVTKLLGLRYNRSTKRWEVQAKWRGFADEEPTWEPLVVMHEDIPDMLNKFLDSFADKDMAKRARDSLRRIQEGGV